MVERAFLASPAPVGGNQIVAAPAQFIFTGTEALRLTVYRMAVGTTLALEGRFRSDASGRVTPFSYDIADATIVDGGDSHEFTFPAGQLYNVRIGLTGGDGEFGVTFVQLQQIIGAGAAAIVIGTLLQGYLSTKSDLAWPGSPIENVHSGRGRILNVGWNVTTGVSLYAKAVGLTRHRYQLIAGRVDIAASAVAGNRSIYLVAQDSGGTIMSMAGVTTFLTASTSRIICFAAGMPARALDTGAIEWLPIAQDYELDSSHEVRVLVTNNQVGDTITGQGCLVRDWFNE
jgi:hypothetical protein